MSRARGPLSRASWVVLAALVLAPAAAATADLSLGMDAPLIDSQTIDVSVGGEGLVDVNAEGELLPTASLELPVLGEVKSSPGSDAGTRDPVAGPPPAPTAPDLPEATGAAAGQASAALVMGAMAAAPAMPWESIGSTLSNWTAQAREALRPAGRGFGRFLKALPFLAPFFTRIGGERLLENPVRARVHDAISQDPGLSVQDVRDRAGVAWGTTIHHLARLERHGLVVSVRHGNHRRYFPANSVSSRHRRELSALSHPTAHRIAVHVTEAPGTDQKGVCRALDLANPAASKHLSRFERLGLVQSEVVGRSRLYHPTELLRSVLATLASLGGLAPVRTPDTTAPAPTASRVSHELADAAPMLSRDVALAN